MATLSGLMCFGVCTFSLCAVVLWYCGAVALWRCGSRAAEALAFGLVSRVCKDHAELMAQATELAVTIASKSPVAVYVIQCLVPYISAERMYYLLKLWLKGWYRLKAENSLVCCLCGLHCNTCMSSRPHRAHPPAHPHILTCACVHTRTSTR